MGSKIALIVKSVFTLLFFWPVSVLYMFSSQKEKIGKDLDSFCQVHYLKTYNRNRTWRLMIEFLQYREFRSLLYCRLGKWSHLISWLYPGQTQLSFDISTSNLGGGVFIQHGYCTDISARRIGENVWINQKVTIGYRGNGCPEIGNNVRIGAGAILLGEITVGDNVNIGAGAIVVEDVPSDCTVCGPKATIVKRKSNIGG